MEPAREYRPSFPYHIYVGPRGKNATVLPITMGNFSVCSSQEVCLWPERGPPPGGDLFLVVWYRWNGPGLINKHFHCFILITPTVPFSSPEGKKSKNKDR